MKTLFAILLIAISGLSLNAQDKNIPAPIAPYSPGVLVDGTLYISGQIPINPENNEMITGDIKDQTRAGYEKPGFGFEIIWF